ncbi:hypothetical protein ACFLS1_12635 [Verrucomicrobiota bacterium]
MNTESYIWIPIGGMVVILLTYLPWIVLKHRKAQTSNVEYTSVPLLSYGLVISLCSFAVFVVLFAVFMFTATRDPDSTHSFGVKCFGGGHLYTRPALAISWMATLSIAGIMGLINFISFSWYNRKGKLNRIKLPIIGRLDMD